jgi:hypothetical protein
MKINRSRKGSSPMTVGIISTNAIASDPIGGLLTSDGTIVYYLTSCCGASAKGSAGSYTGVVCRNCYDVVPASLGAGWLVTDDAAWAWYAEQLRPHLERFTDDAVAKTRAAAQKRGMKGN